MELQRGSCHLCTDTNRVLKPTNASKETLEFVIKVLSDIIGDENNQFAGITSSLRVCSICTFKIKVVDEIHEVIKSTENEGGTTCCMFCNTSSSLVLIHDDWKFFNERIGIVGADRNKGPPFSICTQCVFYLDTLFVFKKNLLYKFPQLRTTPKNPPKRRKGTSTPGRKKFQILNPCFASLQPLSATKYQVDAPIKSDTKLYKKIPYVNMRHARKALESAASKPTPASARPVIKIRLKTTPSSPPPKKSKNERVSPPARPSKRKSVTRISGPPVNGVSKKSRSSSLSDEESPPKPKEPEDVDKSPEDGGEVERQDSATVTDDKNSSASLNESSIEDTPKGPSGNLHPRRRVSLFLAEEGSSSGQTDDAPVPEKKPDQDSIRDSVSKSPSLDRELPVGNKEEEGDENKVDLFDLIKQNVDPSFVATNTNKDYSTELVRNEDSSDESESEDFLKSRKRSSSVEDTGESKRNAEDGMTAVSGDGSGSDDDLNKLDDLDSSTASDKKKKKVTFSDDSVVI